MTGDLKEEEFRVEMQYVYILTSRKNGTLYIGTTRDLETRILQHKKGEVAGFTKKYNVNRLVYFEAFETVLDGVQREKQLKKWNRAWKIELITSQNPNWKDLSLEWFDAV